MLKKYRITVEGKSYEVEVDDMAGGAVAPVATPVATAPVAAPAASAPVAAPAPKAAPEVKGEALRAPMPGTILSVSTAVGKAVSKGEVLLVLEAMKMENEIVAHADGTVAAIYVQKGSTVNAGDPLVAFA